MPFCPSQTTIWGAGIWSNRVIQPSLFSQGTQPHEITCSSDLTIKQTMLPTRMPSTTRIDWGELSCWGLGLMFQHQAIWERQLRDVTLITAVSSSWDFLPSNHETKRSSNKLLERSVLFLMLLTLHFGQYQRCVPAAVRPRFWSFELHVGHWYLYVLFSSN